jgi:hypothetical protein
MMFRDVRLGDDIDDFCVRCKRVMNHAVVSVIDGVAAKVRCRTCHNDHDFRHEQPPPPKVDSRKAALFNQVLKTVDPVAAAVSLDGDVPGETPEIEALEVEALEADDSEPEVKAMVAEAAPAKASAKSGAKSAAKGGAKVKSKAKK